MPRRKAGEHFKEKTVGNCSWQSLSSIPPRVHLWQAAPVSLRIPPSSSMNSLCLSGIFKRFSWDKIKLTHWNSLRVRVPILPTLGVVFWETACACVSPHISSENKQIWPHAFPLLLNSQGESGVQHVHPKKRKKDSQTLQTYGCREKGGGKE